MWSITVKIAYFGQVFITFPFDKNEFFKHEKIYT